MPHPLAVPAVAWLVREVLPRVAAVLRDDFGRDDAFVERHAVLYVAGGGDQAQRWRRATRGAPEASKARVRLVGALSDVGLAEELLVLRRVFVAPLFNNTGIATKIVNAMSHGLPVVTTPGGCRGLGLPADASRALLVAADAAAFARHAARLLVDDALWRDLSRGGRRHVEENLSRDALARVVRDAVSRAFRAPSHRWRRRRGRSSRARRPVPSAAPRTRRGARATPPAPRSSPTAPSRTRASRRCPAAAAASRLGSSAATAARAGWWSATRPRTASPRASPCRTRSRPRRASSRAAARPSAAAPTSRARVRVARRRLGALRRATRVRRRGARRLPVVRRRRDDALVRRAARRRKRRRPRRSGAARRRVRAGLGATQRAFAPFVGVDGELYLAVAVEPQSVLRVNATATFRGRPIAAARARRRRVERRALGRRARARRRLPNASAAPRRDARDPRGPPTAGRVAE